MNRDDVVKGAFRHREALLSYAFALLRDWVKAEDVVQDSFIVVMNKWAEFRPGTSLFLWVRQIVHFKSLEAARAKKLTPVEEELLACVAASMQRGLDEKIADLQRLRRQALQRCISHLDPRSAGLLSGFYAESLSCESLAQLHRRSVNAVRLSLSRLRKQLHDCVRRQLPAMEARG
ncbi:MAG: sigma-70 family RNA polymerase sigma factor [Planctomycetes bacterium]|nr:sigma-70 family RNA polymerase sigma factor [Planctomycetota bacterium]